jgi:hypothetical protein
MNGGPIDAALERALFKRFWTWLGVVGSIVIAAVTAISVLVSQFVVYAAKETATRQIDELNGKLRARPSPAQYALDVQMHDLRSAGKQDAPGLPRPRNHSASLAIFLRVSPLRRRAMLSFTLGDVQQRASAKAD